MIGVSWNNKWWTGLIDIAHLMMSLPPNDFSRWMIVNWVLLSLPIKKLLVLLGLIGVAHCLVEIKKTDCVVLDWKFELGSYWRCPCYVSVTCNKQGFVCWIESKLLSRWKVGWYGSYWHCPCAEKKITTAKVEVKAGNFHSKTSKTCLLSVTPLPNRVGEYRFS